MVTPVWPNVFAAIRIQGGVIREVPLKAEGDRWRLDLDRLFDACDETTKAMFIVSPGNPTGWMMTREEQAAVLAFCRERNILYIADEVYHRFVYEGRERRRPRSWRSCAPTIRSRSSTASRRAGR